MAFHPYLNFGGNCREAFTRYREIFGGELTLLAMSDMPPGNEAPADQADLIMHAALTFDDHVLMASDDPSGRFDGVRGMFVNYSVGDVNEAERVFEALAEGGEVTMPMAETFLVSEIRHVRRPFRHAVDGQRRSAGAGLLTTASFRRDASSSEEPLAVLATK